ncbi:MAG: hypothetical protein Q4C75_05145, partial [Bergeyella zoohelcum]|nr:hypothetical protein [Bergeyella zoohelcum]
KVQMRYVQRQQKFFTDNFNAYFNGDFSIGEIENKAVLGYDVIIFEVSKNGGWNEARGYRLLDGTIANSYRPANAHLYQMDSDGNPMPDVFQYKWYLFYESNGMAKMDI